MCVSRSAYFSRIVPFIDKLVVKVITVIRRCGKSVMMTQIQEFLLQKGVAAERILDFNFESLTDERVKSFESVTVCVQDVQEEISADEKMYLFFDEVQELAVWEKLANSYLRDLNCDIFITAQTTICFLVSWQLTLRAGTLK